MQVQCQFDPDVKHEYPDDWVFGGADETHPGADPRYKPEVYVFINELLQTVWQTTSITCDEQAKSLRMWAQKTYGPVGWIQVIRHDGNRETVWSA